jgi:PAS domain S-box-containing protein
VEELKKEFATSKNYVNPERREELIELLKMRGSVDRFEIEEFKKDGTRVFVEVSGTLHPDQGYIEGFIVDNTDRKHAEKALRESEEKYRTILENIEDGYFEVDIAGNFTFFNDSLCEMLGYSKDELMGMNNRQYTNKENAKELYQTFNRVYTTGKPDKGFDWKIIRKDGTERSVEASVSLRTDAKGKPIGFRGIIRDISEKQRLEAQLQQATKMEAIATLAGGVAHEFNNALMGIMGNIELLKMDLSENERVDKSFDTMKSSGHRMSRLTDQLLAYAQGGKYQPKDLKLDDFTIETLPILQHDLNPEVRVETHFPRDIAHISADQAQMQMVLSAILANSNEAIEDEGLIKITAEKKN